LIPGDERLASGRRDGADCRVIFAVGRTDESWDETGDFEESIVDSIHLSTNLFIGQCGEMRMGPRMRTYLVAFCNSRLNALDIVAIIDALIVISVEEEGGLDLIVTQHLDDVVKVDVRSIVERQSNSVRHSACSIHRSQTIISDGMPQGCSDVVGECEREEREQESDEEEEHRGRKE